MFNHHYGVPKPTRESPPPPPRINYKKLYEQEKEKVAYYKGKLAEIKKIVVK